MKLSTLQRPLIENKPKSFETNTTIKTIKLQKQHESHLLQAGGRYQRMVRQMAERIRSCQGIGCLRGAGGASRKRAQAGLITETLLALLLATALSLPAGANAEPGDFLEQSSKEQRGPQLVAAERRHGGLEPGDYIDEAGELDVMLNQQQIPTAHLMAAAGHIVPENFFLPGGSIPAAVYSRYAQPNYQNQNHQNQQLGSHQHAHHAHHQNQNQQQRERDHFQAGEALQQLASQVQARFLSPQKYFRSAELLAAAESAQQPAAAAAVVSAVSAKEASQAQQEAAALIDLNPYNLLAAGQAEAREAPASLAQADLIEYLTSAAAQNAIFEQQQAQSQQQAQQLSREQQQQQQLVEHQLAAELAALANREHHHQQQQQQAGSGYGENSQADQSAAASEQYQPVGPAYQIAGHQPESSLISYGPASGYESGQMQAGNKDNGKVFGLPTKSSNKEPSGMLKPLGNPKTISSPIIDFVTNQLPKTSVLEKINDKIPQTQTPTVFSFSSSKDPIDKVKGSVNQKKRTVMRQAEQIAKMMIKTINEKFGTNLGDQSDIPFLLSSIGPLGFAQSILTDPTLLVTLLNSAEKTYFSDVLPAPAKMAIRPVLNIFRVPNKKRDKANLSNIISFLASGGQTSSSAGGSKHRQGMGVEKQSSGKSKSNRKR